jgi:hypothetical protein
MKTRIFIFSILVLGLFSCKSSKLDIVEPKEEYSKPVHNTPPSTIGLGIGINIPELEKSLNASMNGLIYEDKVFEDDNRLVKVWKTAPFHFTIKNNVLTCQIPVKFWIKTGFKKQVLGVNLEDYYEANGAMILDLSSSFKIENNWDLTTKSTIVNYKWTENPTFSVAGLNIPIKTLTDIVLFTFNSKILKTVDKSISEKVDLHSTMIKQWSNLYNPIKANADNNIWVCMQPKALYMSPLTSTGNQLNLNVGLNAIIDTYVGIQPDTIKTKTPLPDLKMVKSIQPDFSVYSNIEVPFSKVNELAKQYVVGQEFKKGNKTVKIDSIKVWGQNDKLVVKVNLSGSVKGSVYCVGNLNLNDSTQTLKIDNFDFELNTQSKLLKSANWLLHKGFLKLIEPMLTIPLKEQIDKSMLMTNNTLKNYKFSKGMYLNGRLNDIHLQKISIYKDGFVISGKVDGNIKVTIADMF